MEQTSRAGRLYHVKAKALPAMLLIVMTFLIGRTPFLETCFPAAIVMTAYMVSRSSINLYLIIPAAAGILFYVARGYDPWGDLAALCLSGILLAAAGRFSMKLWQQAIITSAMYIICTSIYRLASLTVYKIDLPLLLFQGVLIFCMMFLMDAFYQTVKGREVKSQLPLIAFAALCLLTAHGMGLGFLLWPVVIFLSLCGLIYLEVGSGLLLITGAGVFAALLDQAQWGFLVTLMIAAAAASFVKPYGALAAVTVFSLVCWGLKSAESGVILGVESYSLFLAVAAFLAIHWKFAGQMKKVFGFFAGTTDKVQEERSTLADRMLREKISDMQNLSQLYATYLDSRSVLAEQFLITGQIMESVRLRMGEARRGVAGHSRHKLQVKMAVSQCAAVGAINGDCSGWQDLGDDRLAMIISDGMGKGKKAASESLLVTRTILSLLKSGVHTDQALKLINTIMLMKDDEDSFATVDLIVLDRKTGRTKFYKIGAAPTLIRRKGRVEEVKLSAVPLGIVNGLKIRYVEADLRKDDWIIMMSDGVSDGGDGKGFLSQIKETAIHVRSSDPQTMCDLILNQAADSYIGRERDDLTVMVARIG